MRKSIEVEKWIKEAIEQSSEEWTRPMPVSAFLGEAVDLARYCRKYWKTRVDRKGKVIRGLETVADPARGLTSNTGEELIALERAAQHANSAWLYAVEMPEGGDLVARARTLVSEISQTLTWVLDDGVAEENDLRLDRVKAAHASDAPTIDSLAGELYDYAFLADKMRSRLDGVGGFDASCIKEAFDLSSELRLRPHTPPRATAAAREAFALRNRILNALAERMAAVRAAARFVYRDQPNLARGAASAFERKRRIRRRGALPAAEEKAPAPAPVGAE